MVKKNTPRAIIISTEFPEYAGVRAFWGLAEGSEEADVLRKNNYLARGRKTFNLLVMRWTMQQWLHGSLHPFG
jgi:hypothetical protein